MRDVDRTRVVGMAGFVGLVVGAAPDCSTQNESAPEKQGYAVRAFLETRVKRGVEHWKVRWEGYPESENSWEPARTLRNDLGAAMFDVCVRGFEDRQAGRVIGADVEVATGVPERQRRLMERHDQKKRRMASTNGGGATHECADRRASKGRAPSSWQCKYVCLDLLREPVKLPCCGRYACLACLHGMRDMGDDRCPTGTCKQRRLSTKLKTLHKNGGVVSAELWQRIKMRFPAYKYNGEIEFENEDEDRMPVTTNIRRVPGRRAASLSDTGTAKNPSRMRVPPSTARTTPAAVLKSVPDAEGIPRMANLGASHVADISQKGNKVLVCLVCSRQFTHWPAFVSHSKGHARACDFDDHAVHTVTPKDALARNDQPEPALQQLPGLHIFKQPISWVPGQRTCAGSPRPVQGTANSLRQSQLSGTGDAGVTANAVTTRPLETEDDALVDSAGTCVKPCSGQCVQPIPTDPAPRATTRPFTPSAEPVIQCAKMKHVIPKSLKLNANAMNGVEDEGRLDISVVLTMPCREETLVRSTNEAKRIKLEPRDEVQTTFADSSYDCLVYATFFFKLHHTVSSRCVW